MNAIVVRDQVLGAVEDLGGLVTPVSLQLPENLRINDWVRIGEALDGLVDRDLWAIADWAAHGDRHYRRDYGSVLQRLARQTVYNLASISRKVEISRRRETLSIWHHGEVQRLDGLEQELWLDEAERKGWTVHELREQIRLRRPSGAERVPALTVRAVGELLDLCTRAAERAGEEPAAWAAGVLERAARETLGLELEAA